MELTQDHRDILDEVLKWRRDVRHFRRNPLDPEVLARLRQRMDCAPSVGNARPWRVLQVDSPTMRASVIESFAACNAEAAENYGGQARADYLALKLAGLREAPVHLAVFTDTTVAEGRGLGRHSNAPADEARVHQGRLRRVRVPRAAL